MKYFLILVLALELIGNSSMAHAQQQEGLLSRIGSFLQRSPIFRISDEVVEEPAGLLAPRPMAKPKHQDIMGLFIKNNVPVNEFPHAARAMLATIEAEVGSNMDYTRQQESSKGYGPGYGLFQMERIHHRKPKNDGTGGYWSRLNPTADEIKRGFKPLSYTPLGEEYNMWLEENELKDSAKSQIDFISTVIKNNPKVMSAFKSKNPEEALESFTKYIIKPSNYLNKKTRKSELNKRFKLMRKY